MRRDGRNRTKTRYVHVDDVRVGYQIFGEGPVDLLFVHGVVSHLELMWGDPAYARFMRRLGTFARVITFDRRGVGVSQRMPRAPTLDERVRDMIAVLDAAGSSQAVALGFSDGGMSTALLAASHPERVLGLILCATAARSLPDEEQPGFIRADYLEKVDEILQNWGTGHNYELFSPTLVGGQMHRQLTGVFERASATKEMMFAIYEASLSVDIKPVLPSISAPTMVIQRTDDFVPFESGRFLAARIPGARFIPIEGVDHVPFAGNANLIVRHIESLVAEVSGLSPRDDRAFQTILFADNARATAATAMVRRRGGNVLRANQGELLATFDTPAPAIAAGSGLTRAIPQARVGIHSGECVVADQEVIGAEVHLAARVRSEAEPGQVLITEVTRTLVPSGFEYRPLGARELKGIPRLVKLYAVASVGGQTTVVPEWRLGLRDRLAVALTRTSPGQTRLLQRVTNRSYARFSKAG